MRRRAPRSERDAVVELIPVYETLPLRSSGRWCKPRHTRAPMEGPDDDGMGDGQDRPLLPPTRGQPRGRDSP
jgi:hypothetical protein